MTPEDFIDEKMESEYYEGSVYGTFAYPRKVVLEGLKEYAEIYHQEQLKLLKTNNNAKNNQRTTNKRHH